MFRNVRVSVYTNYSMKLKGSNSCGDMITFNPRVVCLRYVHTVQQDFVPLKSCVCMDMFPQPSLLSKFGRHRWIKVWMGMCWNRMWHTWLHRRCWDFPQRPSQRRICPAMRVVDRSRPNFPRGYRHRCRRIMRMTNNPAMQ